VGWSCASFTACREGRGSRLADSHATYLQTRHVSNFVRDSAECFVRAYLRGWLVRRSNPPRALTGFDCSGPSCAAVLSTASIFGHCPHHHRRSLRSGKEIAHVASEARLSVRGATFPALGLRASIVPASLAGKVTPAARVPLSERFHLAFPRVVW
jgi:hypothetical protein